MVWDGLKNNKAFKQKWKTSSSKDAAGECEEPITVNDTLENLIIQEENNQTEAERCKTSSGDHQLPNAQTDDLNPKMEKKSKDACNSSLTKTNMSHLELTPFKGTFSIKEEEIGDFEYETDNVSKQFVWYHI